MSEKIQQHHLDRKAILYVRQSSVYQVIHNEESRRLQYAMEHRLQGLGWKNIEVVDQDLGISAAGAECRAGFERMVTDVCLGNVGAVAAREVSRFARNSREWQQLIEVCRIVDTVLIDLETVYSPRDSNDRLLLGLKGSLNEYELDLLRQRSLEARHEKARRGELIVAVPVGFLKTADGGMEKDPDRRVQEAILLVFRKFAELATGRQTLMWFLDNDLKLPVRSSDGQLNWKRPTYAMIYRTLTNPAYGGAYAYGKVEFTSQFEQGNARRKTRRKAPQEWLALIPDRHEGYISWEEFQAVQEQLAENDLKHSSKGAPKHGSALLSGILRCRRCGRRLMIHYTGAAHRYARYACCRGYLDNGEPTCIAFGGIPVDKAIGRQVLRVAAPGAVEAAVVASEEEVARQDDVLQALKRDLEAARYSAHRTQKQYDAADPENRLVAEELERRWNVALERVHELEWRIQDHLGRQRHAPRATAEEYQDLAEDLDAIWNNPDTDVRLKKRIVRTLISEIIADVDFAAGEIILVIHWKGGAHTELRLPRRRRGQSNVHTSKEVVDAVRILARICPDKMIAGFLNRNGLLTGKGNRWTQQRVTSLRCKRQIPCYSEETRRQEGWMNLTEAAKFLGVSSRTLRLAVDHGELEGEHPLSDGPWVFSRSQLESKSAQKVAERAAAHRENTPAVPDPKQSDLGFSET